jgi:hypothetical protein
MPPRPERRRAGGEPANLRRLQLVGSRRRRKSASTAATVDLGLERLPQLQPEVRKCVDSATEEISGPAARLGGMIHMFSGRSLDGVQNGVQSEGK